MLESTYRSDQDQEGVRAGFQEMCWVKVMLQAKECVSMGCGQRASLQYPRAKGQWSWSSGQRGQWADPQLYKVQAMTWSRPLSVAGGHLGFMV